MQLLFNVPPEADGVLLRGFLRRCAVSTELARAVKFHGSGFFADDVPILANRRVQAGQVIHFALPADGPGVEPQPEIPVRVVYEDAFAVVLEKPPHLAVHPTLNYPRDTLANGYAAWAAAHGESPVFRPVNRIDKDTSGLVLAAKNGYAAPLLAEGVEKLYYAIVEGELPLGPGVIDAPIGRRGDSIIGRCVTPEGKPSRTEYTILKAENGLSLAACVPVTGRTHRLRGALGVLGMERILECDVELRNLDGDELGMSCQLVWDRTLWGVRYGSARFFRFMGMHSVDDNVGLTVALVFRNDQ